MRPLKLLPEWFRFILSTFVIMIAMKTLAFGSNYIPSESMVPTLQIGDRLLVDKWAYGWSRYSLPLDPGFSLPTKDGRIFSHLPVRGDVVVFTNPVNGETFIKRVIGLPGDRIQVRSGVVWINGVATAVKPDGIGAAEDDSGGSEPARRYVETLPDGESHSIFKLYDNGRLDNTEEVTVPADHLFVMGDNRDNSADSRVPLRAGGVGLLPMDNLVGRVDAIVGSWDLGVRSQPVSNWLSGFRMARFFTGVH